LGLIRLGNVSKASNVAGAVYSLPPQAPAGLAGASSGYAVSLHWQPSPEGDVIGYLLARDGELLNGLTAVGGATVTASSWEFNWYGSYQPGNAIDSQPYTYWLSARTPTEDEPEWIEVDLGRTELVSRLEIDWYDQWNAPKHFAVEVWDGYGWRGVAEVADNSEALCVATLPPGLRTGKVRVKVFAAYSESSHALVAEIRLLQRALIPTAVHSDQNLTDHLYRYAVSAVDYFGLESLRSEEMAVAVGDVVPPAAPQGLTSTVSGSAVQLDWSQTPNGEADLAGYNVYRRTAFGWTRINAGPVATTIFADENLPNGAYAYRITAIDQVGNESQPSPEAAAEVSITPLAAPTGLAVSAPAEGGSLRLQWQPGDDGAAGHTVFRATVSGGPYVRINDTPATETFFLDAGLANGTRYYYVVAAVDALGNESACSAEASATPYDSVPPSAPVFTAPVRGGENLITVAGAVDVAGSAEPGSLVEVFRNGLLAGSTTATERMVVSETIPWEYTAKRYFASPQGNYLAALGSNKNGMVLCISEVAIRGEECYPTPGYIGEIKWSPNERYVLFGYYESNSWMRRLAVLNRQAGVLEPFTEGEFSETDPSWTTDGRVAFVREQGQSRELWLKDMVSGELQRLADSMPGDYPVISPDGSKVAFIDYQSKELIVLDVESGETSYIICHNYSNFNILFWSGDSNKLAFVASLNESETEGNQIFVVDLEPLTIKPVTTAAGYIYQLAWSPEGDRLAFYRQTYDESVRSWRGSISLADLSANETLAVNDAHAMHLAWSDPETIVVFNGTGYFKINSGGFFNVENIALNSGNNVLYAIAIDASGNQSDPSASVTIRREAASLPDPAIAVADLRLYPPFPLPGEKVMITATVRNVGEAPADGVEAAISLWEAGGAISELARTTLPTLPPGGAEVVSSSATAPERFGRNTIFAVVDPAGKIGEASEENNRAEKEFIVTDKEEVGLSVRLSTGELASNQSLRLDVELGNSGPSRSLALDVRIEDAGGVPVAVLNASTFDINFGFQTLTFVWNSGSTVAGAYRARCVLRDGAAVVTEALKEFVILPDLAVQAALGTDKAAYGPMEQVQMTARVANAGVNSILDELKVDISILGPDRSLVYRKESLVRNLLPGMEAAVQMPWPVGLTPPGDHEVRLVATAHGRTVAQQTAAFRILARPIISGTLDVGSEVVPVGAPISVGFQVVNSGNAAASGMLRAVLSDAATGAVVAGQERGLDLPAGGSSSGRFEFAGDGLGLTSYRINLLHLGGEPQPLASGLFRVVDLAPPAVVILQPQSGEAAGGAVSLVVQASDEASGIAVVEYRIDGGQWRPLPAADPAAGRYAAQWEPTAADGGERLLSVRAADAAGNVSSPVSVTVVVQMDDRPPVTSIEIGQPMVAGEDVVYVSAGTSLALAATDDSSGVAASEYRFDEGAWQSYVAPFTAAGLPDGLHRVGFRSRDLAGNVEVEQTVTVAADSTPPTTAVGFKHQSWLDGTTVFVSAQTEALLSASDSLSGVQTTYCRFDDETSWRICNGPLALADLASGIHTLHYLSVDNVDNTEQEQSVTMTLIGVEVETAFANLPRVLVWTEDPQHLGGKDHPPYTLEDIGALAAEALAGPDRYFTLVTGKDEFWQAFRSGVHNTVMVIRQDVPLDAGALREMREAVHGGMGLLVSLWGNSVPPVWQEVFGIDFKGSLGTSAQQRPLVLFESPVSAGQTLTASGKVLKVDLAGGALAGVIPGESRCSGVHDLALRYPVAVLPGDRITVALSAPQGNKLIPVDEEQTIVGALPGGPVNASLGNTAGDLAIADISADGVTLGIAAPFGYLEASYSLALTLERADGSRLGTGPVMVAPACASHLSPGMSVGPFIVVQAGEDRVRVSDDLPAAVLYRYGRGKAVFLAYDVVASALHAGRDGHLELLRRASTWLRPDVVGPEAGGVAMLETRVRLQGASLPIRTADTLDQRLNHLPLFDLMQHPLESAFHLADGEEAAWRYFLRIPDEAGDYGKTTEVFLGLEEGEALFGATPWRFTVVRDSRALMLAAMQWLDLQLQLHPEATEALTSLRAALAEVANLPRTTAAEAEQVIHALVQALHQAGQLGFDASELREVLDDYLRIVAGEFP
jgi:Tol biopolymer transport system component